MALHQTLKSVTTLIRTVKICVKTVGFKLPNLGYLVIIAQTYEDTFANASEAYELVNHIVLKGTMQ